MSDSPATELIAPVLAIGAKSPNSLAQAIGLNEFRAPGA